MDDVGHGSNSYIASFGFIVSYGYSFAEHVIIDNCSFANVNVFIDILASISIAENFNIILGNVILGNVIIAITMASKLLPEYNESKCDMNIETDYKWMVSLFSNLHGKEKEGTCFIQCTVTSEASQHHNDSSTQLSI